MRVGYGITVWSQGVERQHLDGIGIYTKNLWHELSEQKVDLLGLRFGNYSDANHDIPGTYECVELKFNRQVAKSALLGMPFSGTSRFESGVDLYHATDHHIPKLRNTPVVATIMDAIPLVHPEWVSQRLRLLKNFAFKRTAQWCEEIITISEFSKQDIAEHFKIPLERITSIPLGVNQSFFNRKTAEEIDSALTRHGVNKGAFIFVGTLQPRKNVRRVIEAHRRLPVAVRSAHPLMIIGKYGWGDDALLDELTKMQLESRGYWLNNVGDDDLLSLLQSATALVYPSLYEGFGLPVLEGFASGIPVISSCTTSIPEVAGNAALLVDPTSEDDIANAMLRIAEDTVFASELTNRGLERAKGFTWSNCAQQTMDVYHRVCAKH
jgi:alpha-1,3-rhamnosyl/mannosyltransferase